MAHLLGEMAQCVPGVVTAVSPVAAPVAAAGPVSAAGYPAARHPVQVKRVYGMNIAIKYFHIRMGLSVRIGS